MLRHTPVASYPCCSCKGLGILDNHAANVQVFHNANTLNMSHGFSEIFLIRREGWICLKWVWTRELLEVVG